MDVPRAELWGKIRDFRFDKVGDQLTFTARLARDNGWSVGYARRVVEEYRRFLLLAMVAGHEVTPSEQVDEAWHLHLVYTRSYWDDLCRNVLGRPLHHNPTRGGPAENARHVEQYNKTLASYRAHFEEAAPPDIWPPAEIRFGQDLDHVRASRAQNWIIPKPRLWNLTRKPAGWLMTTALAPVLIGITNPLDMAGPDFLVFYGIVTAIVILTAIVLRHFLRVDSASDDWSTLEPHEVACLGRGAAGVLQSCLAGLVADGHMEVVENPARKFGPIAVGHATYKLRAVMPPDSAGSEIERIMLTSAAAPSGAEPVDILKTARPLAEQIESKLQARGLLETNDSFGPARWWPVILIGGLAMLGVAKFVVGISRDAPVVFLAIWLVGLGVVAVLIARKPLRTRAGARLLTELKGKHENLKLKDFARPGSFSSADLMLVAGLFGVAAIAHPEVQMLRSALKPIPRSDGGLGGTSGGCGGGCGGGGGGGCGGGCGGCGGCGGD